MAELVQSEDFASDQEAAPRKLTPELDADARRALGGWEPLSPTEAERGVLRVTSRSRVICSGPTEEGLCSPVPPPPALLADDAPPPPSDEEDTDVQVGQQPAEESAAVFSELHAAVWLGDEAGIHNLLQGGADVNAEDSQGVTPLMLAVELMPRSLEYMSVIRYLLENGANPRCRSSLGWSPLDVAVSYGDQSLVRVLFDAAQADLQRRWQVRLASIAKSLSLLPDFECRIRWEFESPVIPLLNRLAPSDVLHVRKRGSCLRLDSTLASWKRFRFSKRRSLTMLFIGEPLNAQSDEDKSLKPSRGFFMVNHDKQLMVDMTQSLDGEEAAAVVQDLVKADAMQWDMNVASVEVSEGTTWLGSPAGPCDVNGWSCKRFDVRGELGMTMRKKGMRIDGLTFQDYFGRPLPSSACLPELREKFEAARHVRQAQLETQLAKPKTSSQTPSEPVGPMGPTPSTECFALDEDSEAGSIQSEVLEDWPDQGAAFAHAAPAQQAQPAEAPAPAAPSAPAAPADHQAPAGLRLGSRDRLGTSSHRVSGSVWLATDFPISMSQFTPVLDALAVHHSPMKRLKEIMQSPSLEEAARHARTSAEAASNSEGLRQVFPVRAAVPINLAIKATLQFEAFSLTPPAALTSEVFALPESYRFVARSEAQKTASRAKKRMLIANLAL